MLFQVNAGKKFYKIGNYTKVEILRITVKGIQISHSHGISYITDKDISESQKNLLQHEIEQYHKLKNIHAKNVEKTVLNQTQELDDLIKRLPQMKYKELQAWSRKRIGVYFTHNEFDSKFSSKFQLAKNKQASLTSIKKRIRSIYNESLVSISKKLCVMTPSEIDATCKKWFGKRFSNKKFREEIEKRYCFANNVNCFFDTVNKSIEDFWKQQEEDKKRQAEIERQKKEREEMLRRQEEERKKEEEKKREEREKEEERRRIEREKREELEKEHRWKNSLALQGKSCAEVKIPITVVIEYHYALLGQYWKYGCDYRLYANDQIIATRTSKSMSETFKVYVSGNAVLRAEMLAKNGMGGSEVYDSEWINEYKANYPHKIIKMPCL